VEPVKNIIKSGLLAAVFIVPVLLQPDLGSVMILSALWFFLLIISGLRRRYLISLLAIFLIIGTLAWFFVLKDYQRERLVTFINPASDPLDAGYNIAQATIAIGSGQLWGRGIGFGSQSQLRFLPESHTDFIFAVIAEEMGFVILVLILALFIFYFYRGIKIAKLARDNFTSFLAVGAIILFAVQDFINIGMNMGIMPVTGVPLTFLSYGGSSLLASFILVGILQSINIRNKA
jgi:rod shape determining protein RodA